MVGWLGAAALAAVGGLKAQGNRWRQIPYLGALAAVAVFIGWRFSKNGDEDDVETPEEQADEDLPSADFYDVYEEEMGSSAQNGITDEQSEEWTLASTGEMLKPGSPRKKAEMFGMPNEISSQRGTQILQANIQHGTDELIERVSDPEKDVTEVLPPARTTDLDNLKWETGLIDTSILSLGAEDLDSFISSRQISTPGSQEPDSYVENEKAGFRQVSKDFESFRETSVIVGDIQVDKDVVSVTGSDAVENNLKAKDFPILAVNIGRDRMFSDVLLPIDWENKVRGVSTLQDASVGKNLKDQFGSDLENCLGDNIKYKTSRLMSRAVEGGRTDSLSSPNSEERVILTSLPSNAGLPRGDEDPEMSSSLLAQPPSLRFKAFSFGSNAESCSTAVVDFIDKAPPSGIYDDHSVQFPSPVQRVVDGMETEDDASKSAREEYSERLHAYDEYLSDPQLSPTLRSQVLRAKASLERYFEDSDEDQ